MSSLQRTFSWLGRAADIAVVAVALTMAIAFFTRRTEARSSGRILTSNVDDWRSLRELAISEQDGAAPMELVVFIDHECPFCLDLHQVLQRVETSQPGSFRVSTIFFPLPQHRNAVRAANAAFCAHEQGRLNAMTEALYANRGRWSSRSELVIAREAGVADEATFLRCMSQADTFPSVRAGIQAANRLGLTGTPSLVLNGKLLTNISSARALEDYLLDEARAFTRR